MTHAAFLNDNDKRFWIPHWLRCHWSRWSDLEPIHQVVVFLKDGRERRVPRVVQRRICLRCGKSKIRRVA
jgi:hypothetical protein